jgi:hypothetical protein
VNLEVREPKQPGFLMQLIGSAFSRVDRERHPRFWVIGTNRRGAVVLKIASDHQDEAWKKHDRRVREQGSD